MLKLSFVVKKLQVEHFFFVPLRLGG